LFSAVEFNPKDLQELFEGGEIEPNLLTERNLMTERNLVTERDLDQKNSMQTLGKEVLSYR